MGQFLRVGAIVPDGSVLPEPRRDPELYYEQSNRPRLHLPHAWVGDQVDKLATMDIARTTQFTLITALRRRLGGRAEKVSATSWEFPLAAVVIGPGRPISDLVLRLAKVREVEESGAAGIRPDKHVAWRASTLPADPQGRCEARSPKFSAGGHPVTPSPFVPRIHVMRFQSTECEIPCHRATSPTDDTTPTPARKASDHERRQP